MAHVIAVLGVVFGFLLCGSPASAEESARDIAVMVYTYDAPAYDALGTYTATERGPPVTGYANTTHNGVDIWSHGASPSLDATTPAVTTGYDHPPLVQDARVGTTTHEGVELTGGDLRASSGSSVAAKTLAGSGPVPGVLEASGRVKSFAALQNYNPKGGVEYVFDPASGTFAVGRPAAGAGLKGSPHEQLAQSIGANPSSVVGGTLTRGGNGAFITTEQSGHYWQNWTPQIRQQFVSTMRGYGFDVFH